MSAGDTLQAALAVELRAAAHAIELLETGRRLPDGVAAAAARFALTGPSRAALQDIAAGTARRLGTVRALAARLNRKPPAPALAALQFVAISQLLGQRRADAVVVDQAVEAVRLAPSLGDPAAAFLNATLRRLLREREALMEDVRREPVARWNYPDWWIDTIRRDHAGRWQQVLTAGDAVAPMTLRVNRRRADPDEYLARLAAHGVAADRVGPVAIRLARHTDPVRLPGYADGLFSVQDLGAQLAAPLLDARDGHRVLDACAAPGGKAAHLLERADCRLTALDVDDARLGRVRDGLARLGLTADVRAGDGRAPADWWDGEPFDRILLDAPCSASGIVRRHPDVRWLRRRSDLATLSATQSELLEALWPLLRPGGKLLFATCSVFRIEGEGRIERFRAAHADSQRLPLTWRWNPDASEEPVSQLLPGGGAAGAPSGEAPAPAERDHDGFFYALLQKPT